jgi:ferredoxin-type protein NapF
VLRDGDGGFPRIDFSQRGCTLCGACVLACNAGALQPGQPAFSRHVQVGPECLAQRGVECRICGDACGVGALHFVPQRGGVGSPLADLQACTGCGSCVAPCPVGAIRMA